jgi:hypothetical protein
MISYEKENMEVRQIQLLKGLLDDVGIILRQPVSKMAVGDPHKQSFLTQVLFVK